MSGTVPIETSGSKKQAGAPTPVNTPLTTSVLSGGHAPTLSRPTIADVEEDPEEIATEGVTVDRDLLQSLVAGRIADLIGKSSGYIESLPDAVKKNVEGLKGVDVAYQELYKQFKKESLELEAKFAAKYAPVFARRAAIIAGKEQPTADEIKKGEEVSLKDDEDYTPLADSVAPAPEGIPEFWLTALRNHVGISELITDRDAPALKHLKDIRAVQLPTDTPGFKLEFEFAPNEYFDNTILTKTYYYEDELGYGGDYVYKNAEGCKINWKDEEKNLTKSYEIKKQRNKNTNRTRLVRKAHPADSFFNFFTPPVAPDLENEDDEEVDAEELEHLEESLELDYQIGEDLKERVIPKAIDFFTGKALEYEDDDEDDDEDYEDVDDEDDEDDDEDDDDSDTAPQLTRRRGPPGGAGQQVNTEECKQQ